MTLVEDESKESQHEKRDQALFDRIAQTYASKDLDVGAAHARKHRLIQTLVGIDSLDARSVLEVGCGAGYAARYLGGRYGSYEGIDYSNELIDYAKAHNQLENVEFQALNVKDLPDNKKFDVIFMVGVLHHLDDADAVMDLLTERLAPGGWLVANEPHRGNPFISAMRYVRKKTDSNYSEDQIEYKSDELNSLFKNAGYENISIDAQGFLSTPFAEVVFPVPKMSAALSKMACGIDGWFERRHWTILPLFSWNLVVKGQKTAIE